MNYCTFKKQDYTVRQRSNRVQKDSVTWKKNLTTYKLVVCAGKTLRHVSGSRIENSKMGGDVSCLPRCTLRFRFMSRANVTHKVSRGEGGLIRKTACLSHRSEQYYPTKTRHLGMRTLSDRKSDKSSGARLAMFRMPCSKRCNIHSQNSHSCTPNFLLVFKIYHPIIGFKCS